MTNKTATFAKLQDGTWGLRGPKSAMTVGRLVHVTKKDGTRDARIVGEIVWTDGTTVLARMK